MNLGQRREWSHATSSWTSRGMRCVPQAPLPGQSMALHSAGSSIPSTKGPESSSLPSGQGAFCSQEGRGFGGDMLKQLARDSNDMPPSPVSGLATALGVVQSPRAPTVVVSAVMERSRGDPMALPFPAGFTPSRSSAPRTTGARDVPHTGAGVQAASPAPGASGPGSTTAPRVQDAATSPHIPALLPGTAPVRCWDGKSLAIRAGQRSWGLLASGVAKPGSRTGRNDREHLQTPHC